MSNFELIDAEKLFEEVGRIKPRNKEHYKAIGEFMNMITNSTRLKGEWIRTTNPIGETIVVCSKCGKIRQQGYGNFCGFCGADMRGDKE